MDPCHIIPTDQIFLLWSRSARRYRSRVPILGFPSFIFLADMIDGAKEQFSCAGKWLGLNLAGVEADSAKQHMRQKGRHVEEMLKVYLLQVLFYHITGSPFRSQQHGAPGLSTIVASPPEPSYE